MRFNIDFINQQINILSKDLSNYKILLKTKCNDVEKRFLKIKQRVEENLKEEMINSDIKCKNSILSQFQPNIKLQRKNKSNNNVSKSLNQKYNNNNRNKSIKFLKRYSASMLYKSINSTFIELSDITINNFVQNYEEQALSICKSFYILRFIQNINLNLIDEITSTELHPIIKNFYSPYKTKSDGNCLYNMVSLCLIGNQSFSRLLRVLTLYTILKYKKEFLNIISKDALVNSSNDDIRKKYNEIIYEAKSNNIWCNEYHLLAVSTFLNTKN